MGAVVNRLRTVIVITVLCLLAAACGSRVDEEAREFVMGAGEGIGTQEGVPGGADPDADPGDDGFAVGEIDPDADPDDPEAGEQPEAADDEDAPTAEDGTPRDTRAAPPGGNGGATDVGVTEDRIVVSNVADVSGPVPGLFEDAQLAVQAYVAMFAATEGTIYGRELELIRRDARMDTGANRNAYLQACDDSLAAVGSMSAFEQGAAPVIEDCAIPDLRTAAVHPDVMDLPTMYSSQPLSPERKRITEYRYWHEQHGDAVEHAAYLYIDADTTRFQSAQDRQATEQIGYEWIYTEQIDIAETNYAPFVREMRDRGVRYVQFQGDWDQARRLAEAMRQQDYWPDVYVLQSNAYTPNYIQAGGEAVEGTEILVPSALLEEIDANEEMQLYAQWLNHVAPGEEPTGLGMYAWAAAKLFVQAVKDVGPELTREGLIEELRQVGTFDANGIIAPHDVGAREPTTCVIVVRVEDQRFQRVEPQEPGSFRCDGDGLVSTP